ncbi:MAG: ABC transporter ATP-binding protein [Sulfurovum sp.]|nr:ABC transporter ATP-binding protein [Sulfurovum sp.]
MSIIEIKNLSFAYETQTILKDIDLSVKEKDFLAIIGPNGGGKSTLLKLILGMHRYQQGSIHILIGKSPKQSLGKIGYVPQDTNVNTDFPIKVIEVVMMGHIEGKRPLFGYGRHELSCAMGVLAQVGMADFALSKIGALSGGQRQRVMIARALCSHPQILILDEPTSSIDITGQHEIYELLKVLNETITVIVVSHDISVILEYANKVAHIHKKLSYHDISNKNSTFHTHHKQKEEHFCEIELLQMLGSDNCHTCEDEAS